MRVVSLLPSASEWVCALGAQSQLVGVSHECDHPLEIQGRPVLTRSRIEPGHCSKEIDTRVRHAIEEALSIYKVDEVAMAKAAPDLVITQDLCEVCAVSLTEVQAALAKMADNQNTQVLSLHPMTLEDVHQDLFRVAKALGRSPDQLADHWQARVDRIASLVRGGASSRPRVATVEWLDPIMLGGTWMPELIELAGGVPVGVEAGIHAPTVTTQELAALKPEIVVFKPCGFSIPRSEAERGRIQEILDALPCVERAYIADGNALFNRPGPRILDSAEVLLACIHPELAQRPDPLPPSYLMQIEVTG